MSSEATGEPQGDKSWPFLSHFKTHTLLRQGKRISVSLACPQTFGEGGGSGSGLVSPPAHGGEFHEHYQLDEVTAVERKKNERLASTTKLPSPSEQLVTDKKPEFLILHLHVGALCQSK